MLDVHDLHAFYGKSHILQGVDLRVGQGEIVSLLGRTGPAGIDRRDYLQGPNRAHGKPAPERLCCKPVDRRFESLDFVNLRPIQVCGPVDAHRAKS